jgi:hypothetical protein
MMSLEKYFKRSKKAQAQLEYLSILIILSLAILSIPLVCRVGFRYQEDWDAHVDDSRNIPGILDRAATRIIQEIER